MSKNYLKMYLYVALVTTIQFHFFVSPAVAAESWTSVFSSLTCKIDLNLECSPAAKAPDDLIGEVWEPRSPSQRRALYLSNDVQGNVDNCRQFARLIRTECKIKKPTNVNFYDSPIRLLETSMIADYDAKMDRKLTNPQAFKDYFNRAKVVSCPNSRMQNEKIFCATSVANPQWFINGSVKSNFSNLDFVKISEVKLGANAVTIKESASSIASAGTSVIVASPPKITLNCALLAKSLKASCTATITNQEKLTPIRSWFVNGAPIAPGCLTNNICKSGVLPPGTQYIQLIAKTLQNETIKSNVYPLTINLSTATAVNKLMAPVISGFAPTKAAVNIGTNTKIVIVFNKAITAGSGSIEIRRAANAAIEKTIDVSDANQVTISGSRLTISPSLNLTPNLTYYLVIRAGAIRDIEGYSFAGLFTKADYSFTTTKCQPPANSVSVTYGAGTLPNCGLTIKLCEKAFYISSDKKTCVACADGKVCNGITSSP